MNAKASSTENSADLVISNAKVITVDKDFTIKEALAVKDGRIIAVGTNNEVEAFIGPDTRVLDLAGKSVMPGINEAHMHAPFFGATRPPLALDLTFPAIQSIQDMIEVLRQKVSEVGPGLDPILPLVHLSTGRVQPSNTKHDHQCCSCYK